jgi:hypothetical protein
MHIKYVTSKFLPLLALVTVMMIAAPQTGAGADRHRVGALCNDGTNSSATGSGACSHHHGVKCWKYSDGSCTKP